MNRRRKMVGIGLLMLVVVFGPYALSRLASHGRMLRVVEAEGVATSVAAVDVGQKNSLRIVAYNIAHGRGLATSNWEGGDGEIRTRRLDDIADLLLEIDADVVVLNEVDFDSSWSGGVNQAAYLAEKANYPFRVEGRNLDFRMLGWTWRFGNAVLSRYPIVDAEVVDLPGYKKWETVMAGKKRAVRVDIRIGDHRVSVIGAHLSHRSEELRVRSARYLVDLANASRLPVIVVGDLNSTPPGFPHSQNSAGGYNTVEILDESGLFQRRPIDAPGNDLGALTYHSVEPRSVIDWILVPLDWQIVDYQVIDSILSDHRPVLTEVELSR